VQFEITRHHCHAEQHEDALRERNRTRILEHDVDTVENERHNQNIENIQQRNGRQNAAKLRRHRKIKRHKNPLRKFSHLF